VRTSIVVDNKKYMWDGVEYRDVSEADAAAEQYAAARFEIHRVVENGTVSLFTRRVVTEIKLEGAPS
jgi:hypothetical protein